MTKKTQSKRPSDSGSKTKSRKTSRQNDCLSVYQERVRQLSSAYHHLTGPDGDEIEFRPLVAMLLLSDLESTFQKLTQEFSQAQVSRRAVKRRGSGSGSKRP